MKYTIDLSCDALRQILTNEQKKVYDEMTDFFIEHHYDEDHPIEELMLDNVATQWPATYMFFVRKQAQEQHIVNKTLDAKLRVELESFELKEKIDKLEAFLSSDKRLQEQILYMRNYYIILQDRLNYDFKENK